MILIFSRKNDTSTDNVIDWIASKGGDFARINHIIKNALNEKSIFRLRVSNKESSLYFNNEKVLSVWLRKNPSLENYFESAVYEKHIYEEFFRFKESIFSLGKSSKEIFIIGKNPSDNSFDVNKIKSLFCASNKGLKIPNTIVSNSKVELEKFINENGSCIVKPISNPAFFRVQNATLAPAVALQV